MVDHGWSALDRAVDAAVEESGLPGVVAMLADRRGTVYERAAGEATLGTGTPMAADAVLAVHSTTKAVTGTAVLQLVEEGLLDLDAPAQHHVPEIGTIQVIERFDDDGTPRLRAPKRPITTRMLMLHTAGFGYDFFNATYARLTRDKRFPPVATCRKAALMTPLLFDPGERWEYGSGIDWCGLVVEAIRGERLGDVFRARIFEPLGMADTGFTLTEAMRARRVGMHKRQEDGALAPIPGFELPAEPEVQMGGQGLYSTAGDYMKSIRMWLNDGMGPSGPVLRPDTVAMAVESGLEGLAVRKLPGVIPAIAGDFELFPGQPKTWAYTFMVNDEAAPTGRPAGSLGWCGLSNIYFWIDRKNGFGGFWATQLFPFADPAALAAAMVFETAAYRAVTPE